MSQQYPQQQPAQGPPPGWQPPPPSKKKHRFRNFVVFPFLGLIVLIIVIVAASSGGGGNGPGTATDDKSSSVPDDRGQPRPVAVGKEFTIGKHRLDNGWKLEYQQYLGSKVTGTVTNVSKSTSTAIFHIKFLKGNAVVGNMQCVSNDLEPAQQEAVECQNTVSGDTNLLKKGAYDKVTAEATF